MNISVAGKAAAVLVCLVVFSTCGELETLLPSSGTYQVRTLVNDNTLEECSIVRSNDKIRPYFAVSVVNDPDLIGLLVYLEDSRGNIIGDKVQYTLLPYADESALTETGLPEEAQQHEAEPEEKESTADEYQIMERWSFTDAKSADKKSDVEIAVKSFAQELPYFLLPNDLEIGPYILVFEALGKRETLSRMETNVFYIGNAEFNLKDISMYLPGLSSQQLISPGTVIMLEASLGFDSRFDPYVIWYNGKNIISEGKVSDGAGKLLWKAPEQAGFSALRLEAFPFHLKRAVYTGISREIALPVSPKAISLGYFFENNQKYTARSPLSAGTAYPAMAMNEETPREGTSPAYPAPELLAWYQFEGSLHNSLSPLPHEQTLLPAGKIRARWTAAGQSYGLSIGQDDLYLLPPINFFREKQDQGGGILLSHIKPFSRGIIFSAFFPLQSSPTEGVWIDMIKEDNVIELRLSAADTFVDLPVYLTFSAADGFVPIAVEFYIQPNRLEAKISLDEYNQSRVGEIKFTGVLSGEGIIRLGSGMEKTILDKSINEPTEEASFDTTTITDSAGEMNAPIPAAVETPQDTIWDELAILFSAVPLMQTERLENAADAETNYVEARNLPLTLTDTNANNSIQERAALTAPSDNF